MHHITKNNFWLRYFLSGCNISFENNFKKVRNMS